VSAPDPEAWGIAPGYWDVAGQWHDVAGSTVAAVLAAMGATGTAPEEDVPLLVVEQGGPWDALPAGDLELEDGQRLAVGPGRSGDLPVGYHRLVPEGGGRPVTVAVAPGRCPAPPPGRTWGWSVQLYGARSGASWGIGDFADLRRLVGWAGANGAGFVLVNPLHAPAPGAVPEASPYFPSSRCFLNPVYIRVEEVPGADGDPTVAALGERARALNQHRLVDREQVWGYKSEALELLFARFDQGAPSAPDQLDFESFRERRGRTLDLYTTFCAIAERHGLPWQEWPEELRHPEGAAVGALAADPDAGRRKRYHAWLQWLCEAQLAAAGDVNGAGLLCDLAVGADGGGADAWMWQDTLALGMRVGAPPDEYNLQGQDWGLPPWDPWRLRSTGYGPYIEVLRSVLRGARGLRIDHVMGLFRLFWVPAGATPAEGAFVRSPWQDMVGLLELEAHRAGAYVVGEDLGTVEDHVREVLGHSGALSYRLLWFEPGPPSSWPSQALAAVTTHDLPTVAGAWTGADLEAQQRIGLAANEAGAADMRSRLATWAGVPADATPAEAVEAAYAALASAPCALLAAVLEDAALVEERPNMPGTIDQWPNWCLALPVTIEQLETSPLAQRLMGHLRG
jgi:4-alpha-glucanotransferase